MKNSEPLVSFLMPVYNGEKTVARAIESVLNQSYANLEIVMVDDGSIDGSYSICRKYAAVDRRVCVYQNHENLGVAKSLNKGLGLCAGKYIARMDADDFSIPDRIKKQVKYMEAHPNAGVLGSQINIVNDLNGYIDKSAYPEGNQQIKCALLFGTPFAHPVVMLRKDVLNKNNQLYPERPAEDYALWVDMSFYADFETLPEALLEYRVSEDSVSVSAYSAVRRDSAKISRYAIQKHLGIDVSSYPDIHFGWRENDGIPYDICDFLLQSSQLLCSIKNANNKLGKFNIKAMDFVLTRQWRISKKIASMDALSDDFTSFSENAYNKMINEYKNWRKQNKVVIFSAGRDVTQMLSDSYNRSRFQITGIVDSDKSKQGLILEGNEVIPPEKLTELSYDYVLIGSSLYFDEIKEFLINDLKIKDDRILAMNNMLFHLRRNGYIDSLTLALKTKKPAAYLFCAPDYGNLGDHAIAEAEKRFFDERGYKLIEVPLHRQQEFTEIAHCHIKTEDLILITGGGFLGSLWLSGERSVRNIISKYPDNRIIILPQTVYWDNDFTAKRELKLTQEAYAYHKNLTLFARDKVTFEQTKELYSNTNVLLAPDMALYDDWRGYYSHDSARNGALLCLKFDKESVLSNAQKQYLADICDNIGLNVRYRSTDSLKSVWIDDRTNILKGLLQDFRNAELIITDRLHGCVFAAVTGTPCVVLGAYTHKNRATFEWVRHLPYMRFAETLDCVEALASEVINIGEGVYDNVPLKSYYDNITEVINGVNV